MFCTFCYHGDCRVAQAQPARARVCGRAISRAQILKLFSEETTAKGSNTHHPLSSFLPLSLPPSSHLPHSAPIFLPPLPSSLPYHRSSPSHAAPPNTPTRPSSTPMATVRGWIEGRILTGAAGRSSRVQSDLQAAASSHQCQGPHIQVADAMLRAMKKTLRNFLWSFYRGAAMLETTSTTFFFAIKFVRSHTVVLNFFKTGHMTSS